VPTIRFILPGLEDQYVEAEPGQTVMEAAISAMVPGVIGECGGCCCCATCHVQVEPAWFRRLEPADEMEADMLEFAVEPVETSRLGCQIRLTEEFDGFTARIPEDQM